MKPISNNKRFAVTGFLTLLFLVGAPLLVLYSTGYRLDEKFSVVKTGGVFIHSKISGTQVFINDDFVEDNGVILRNTLIQDLRPNKIYSVKVQKDGYLTWQKELLVRPNLVTEVAILMLPVVIEKEKIPEFLQTEISTISTRATSTKTLPNPEYEKIEELFNNDLGQFEIILSTTTKSLSLLNESLLPGRILGSTTTISKEFTTVLYASTTLPDFIEKLEIEDIYKKDSLKEKGKNIAWIENGDVVVTWAGESEAIPYIYCINTCAEKITVSLDTPIEKYDFFPGRDDVLIVLTLNDIFAIEIDHRSAPNLQPIYQGEDLDFVVEDNNKIFVKDSNGIFKLDL